MPAQAKNTSIKVLAGAICFIANDHDLQEERLFVTDLKPQRTMEARSPGICPASGGHKSRLATLLELPFQGLSTACGTIIKNRLVQC